MLPENRKNKLSYRFFDPLPAENNNKKQNFACGGASRHHRHLVSVYVIINHQCAIVSLERVQNRAVLVWVPPLFKVQCCQRSRRCQHGTLSHHRTSWWNPRMEVVVRHPSKPCFGASKKKTLTTLNFAMVRSEKPVLPTVSEKKNTKTPACVMQSANSRSSVCVREQNFGFVYFAFFYYDDCELELERSSSDGGAARWPILLLTHVFAETLGRDGCEWVGK